MSVFDIKSIVNFSHPIPLSVWAVLCAIVFVVLLLRSKTVPLPDSVHKHAGRIWLALFALPITLILALWGTPEPTAPSAAVPKAQSQSIPPQPLPQDVLSPSRAEALKSNLTAACTASQNLAAVSVVTLASGHRVLLARRSVPEVDPRKRFDAFKVSESGGLFLLTAFVKGTLSGERVTIDDTTARSIREEIRVRARGELTGITQQAPCYDGEQAWVVVELPLERAP